VHSRKKLNRFRNFAHESRIEKNVISVEGWMLELGILMLIRVDQTV